MILPHRELAEGVVTVSRPLPGAWHRMCNRKNVRRARAIVSLFVSVAEAAVPERRYECKELSR